MADRNIALKITSDSKQAQEDLGTLQKQVEGVDDAMDNMSKDRGLEDRLKQLNKTVKESPVNIRAMNKQIQEYQAIALEAGRTSPIGQQALKEAADIRDRYVDIQNEVKRLSDDGLQMQAALDLGSGVLAGYTAFQGAMALSGVESEELRETLVKLQGAQSALMGIERIRTMFEKESTVVIQARNIAEKARIQLSKEGLVYQKASIIATKGQLVVEKLYNFVKTGSAVTSAQAAAAETARGTATAGATVATTAATGAMKLFRLALIATGIGVIVVGLGLLITNFDKVRDAVLGAVDKLRSMGTGIRVLIGVLVPFIGVMDLAIMALEEFGVINKRVIDERAEAERKAYEESQKLIQDKINLLNEEKKAVQAVADAAVESLDWEIKKRQAAGQDFADLEKEKLGVLIRSTQEQLALIQDVIDARQRELELAQENLNLFAAEKAKILLKDAKNEQAEQQENLKIQLQNLELFNIKQEKLRTDNLKRSQKSAKKEVDINKDKNDKILKDNERLYNEQAKQRADQTKLYQNLTFSEQELELRNLSDQFDKKYAIAQGNNELMELLREDHQKKIQAINEKYGQIESERKSAEIEANKDIDKKSVEDRLNEASQLVGALTNLNNEALEAQLAAAGNNEEAREEIRKKAFKRTKALQLAEATINGAQAVLKALSSPLPFVLGPLVAATAAANIAKIAASKYQGVGGDSGGAQLPSTGRGSTGANVPTVSNTTTTIGEPTQVYVTEQDISNTQNKVTVAEQQATL